ncbi:hypothetical protein O3M35_001273 [Rhynocoris fuscipes]|uniref:Ribosomal protein L32 n=1 Tax=Rhynocoris fuscipes TaxID=488301 RepID=A0AAW1DPU0_9HEMI
MQQAKNKNTKYKKVKILFHLFCFTQSRVEKFFTLSTYVYFITPNGFSLTF